MPHMPPAQIPWHAKTVPEILGALRSRESGLTEAEAVARLREYGPNKLPEGKEESLFAIFARQFRSPLIYLLLAAAAIVLWMGETADAAIISAVLFFNAVVGTIQEGRARGALRAGAAAGLGRSSASRTNWLPINPAAPVIRTLENEPVSEFIVSYG